MYGKKSGDVNLREYAQDGYVAKFRSLAVSHFQTFKFEPFFAPSNLSLFVGQLIKFMEKWAGRDSPKPCPFTRLPAQCFRDFTENGALATILKGCFDFKTKKALAKIDLEDESRLNLWFEMFGDITRRLKAKRFIRPKYIFFDLNIAPVTIQMLKKIATDHGAIVVSSPKKKCTHIITNDMEIDESEDDFLRTLHVDEAREIAYVHWWYYPSSYDEWVHLGMVQGQSDQPQPPKGPFILGARWLRDLSKFNEWMSEYDYEIPDANILVPQEAESVSKHKFTDTTHTSLSLPPQS